MEKSNITLYKIISLMGSVIISFIKNPFENMPIKIFNIYTFNKTLVFNDLEIPFKFPICIPITKEIMNGLCSFVLWLVTLKTVGLVYNKYTDNPAVGSVLYLLFYLIYHSLICIIINTYFVM